MKFHFKVFAFIVSFFSVFCSYAHAKTERSFWVKVLLNERQHFSNEWIIASQSGFVITETFSDLKKIRCTSQKLRISVCDGFFYLNGKKFLKKQFFVQSCGEFLGWNGNEYKGSFFVVLHNGKAQLINVVDLEDYIFAVLRSESWPGWPLEVNKVFAVATRSYVIAKVREAKKTKRLFHIKNTRIHQTYNGHTFQIRNSKVLRQAVEKTKGQFLAFDGQPIVAMFDSCCGGIVPAKVMGVDFNKAPYLARESVCVHCKRCKLYRWQVEYTLEKWTTILKKKFPNLQKLRGIKILARDGAGLIQELEIKGKKHSFFLTGKELYSLLDEVKSFYFVIRKKGKNIVLKGRGYGHHLGLCQWGAREMVRDEWNYKKILEFYYPNTSFVRLS